MRRMTMYVLAGSVASLALAACNKSDSDEAAQVAAPVPAAASPSVAPPKTVVTEFRLGAQGDAANELKTHCAVDKINGQVISASPQNVSAGGNLDFSGWVADPTMHVPANFQIELVGTDVYVASASAGFPRPDLVRVLKQDGLGNAGFNVHARLGTVAPGEYAVSLTEDAGGKVARCVTVARISVVAAPAQE